MCPLRLLLCKRLVMSPWFLSSPEPGSSLAFLLYRRESTSFLFRALAGRDLVEYCSIGLLPSTTLTLYSCNVIFLFKSSALLRPGTQASRITENPLALCYESLLVGIWLISAALVYAHALHMHGIGGLSILSACASPSSFIRNTGYSCPPRRL